MIHRLVVWWIYPKCTMRQKSTIQRFDQKQDDLVSIYNLFLTKLFQTKACLKAYAFMIVYDDLYLYVEKIFYLFSYKYNIQNVHFSF